MKQSLQLKLGQQLTMTPQLQQAIRLLQLSTMDLQQEIQQALDSNPLLEVSEEDDGVTQPEPLDDTQASNTDGPLQSLEKTASDSDGDNSDWIEIFNPDGVAVDLSGYYLTDDATMLTKWQIPMTTSLSPSSFSSACQSSVFSL